MAINKPRPAPSHTQPYKTSTGNPNPGTPNPDKVGALWKGKTQNGVPKLSGIINGQRVIIFPNSFKTEDKHPDYVVYISKPQGGVASEEDPKPSGDVNEIFP